MAEYKVPGTDWFIKNQITPPQTTSHGTEQDVREGMTKMMPTSWRQEGNKLIGDTEMGEIVNFIPTDMMLKGTDDDGMPILVKI